MRDSGAVRGFYESTVPTVNQLQTCPVLGMPLAMVDYEGAARVCLAEALARARPYLVEAANTHVVALARHDRDFREIMAHFDLILPDGMPLRWCMNRQAPTRLADRVYGPTFMLRTLERSAGKARHFLLGGTEELLAELTAKLRSRFPALEIAGTWSPPFGIWPPEEDARIVAAIVEADAHFVWIGLGCPKQEAWVARMKPQLPPGVYATVGAAFAFHAGRVKQAPPWLQKRGLEWAFRLWAEPRRLWKRYVVFNSLFLFYLLADGVRGRR